VFPPRGQSPQLAQDGLGVEIVEIPRRLVGQNERRPVEDGAAIGHALLLSAGQLRRVVSLRCTTSMRSRRAKASRRASEQSLPT